MKIYLNILEICTYYTIFFVLFQKNNKTFLIKLDKFFFCSTTFTLAFILNLLTLPFNYFVGEKTYKAQMYM